MGWSESTWGRRMSSLKITLHLLALCLLLSITTKVSGKPNPRHLLIETDEQATKTADYKAPGTDYNKAENNDDYQQFIHGNQITNSNFNPVQLNGGCTSTGSMSTGCVIGNGNTNNFNQGNSGSIAQGGSEIKTGGNNFNTRVSPRGWGPFW